MVVAISLIVLVVFGLAFLLEPLANRKPWVENLLIWVVGGVWFLFVIPAFVIGIIMGLLFLLGI